MEFKLSFLLVFLIPVFSYAGLSCQMSKHLQVASQSGKLGDHFWQDYAKASKNGINDRELNELMSKHGVGKAQSDMSGRRSTDVAPTQRIRPQVSKSVYKDVDRLAPPLKQKYAEVVEQLTKDPSGAGFYKNPGRWHFEKIGQYGPHAHSVRLDGGYRVLVDIKDGIATIRQVDKTIGH